MQPFPHPSIYRGRGKGGRPPLDGSRGGGRRPRGRGLAPQARGAPPLGFPQTLGRMGPWGGGAPSHFGRVPFPLQPMSPSGRGGPSRWTLEAPPVAPVQYRYAPELFRCLFDNFPYINLYLRTIPELLVTSRISSGTPNNIR